MKLKDKLKNKENEEMKEKCCCNNDCQCSDECHCEDDCCCDDEDNACNGNCGCHCEEENVPCNEECRCLDGEECTCNECDCTENLIKDKDKMISELQNKLMYKDAELINYRKRKDEETQNLMKYASQDIILDILNSIDNFERAILSVKEDDTNKNLMIGIKMIYNELVNTLKKYGVEEIESLNKEFDHNLHNAVMTDENKDVEDNIITEVLQKGYKYKDRVIRPAMVKVNKIS